MSTKNLVCIVAVCQALNCAVYAAAEPVVTITDEEGILPSEAFFAANPTAVVNVEDFGLISPGEPNDPFDFNGATVNINDDGALGWHTLQPYVDDLDLNLYAGGIVHDRSTFAGSTGSTTVTIHDGWARGRLTMQGNSVLNVNGGTVGGGQPFGAAAIQVEGDSTVTINAGSVEHYVAVRDNAKLNIDGGTVGDFLNVEDLGHLTISGGSVGRLTHIRSATATVEISGGTIDREFMATDGATITMSGGAIGDNSLLRDSVMNMSDGALASGFKIFNSTLNMTGGTFGDNLKLGAFTGQPGTLNLFVKSATIDGTTLDLPLGLPFEVTQRDDAFLSAELIDGGSVGLILNSDISNTIDYLRADSTLNLIRTADDGDYNLDGRVDSKDFLAWQANPALGSLADWQANYGQSISTVTTSVPEPTTLLLGLVGLALCPHRRR